MARCWGKVWLAVTEHLLIWQRRLAEPGSGPMLLRQDERVIGLLYWQPAREWMTARIRALYLHPDHWYQSLGRRLWLLDGNRIGETLYQRCGFVFDGQERTLMSLDQSCLK